MYFNTKINGLNMFFVPIKLVNFGFRPYKIKSHVFVPPKLYILVIIPKVKSTNICLTEFHVAVYTTLSCRLFWWCGCHMD